MNSPIELKVMICDDINEIRQVLKLMVESQEGFNVCSMASNGNEAMELFTATKPDVVLLDVDMPEKSGIDVARFIHDIDPRVHIIFATAHSGFMDKAFDVYAFDYWIKPFRKERVISTLRKIRDLRQRLSQAPAAPSPSQAVSIEKPDISRLIIKKKDAVLFINTGDIVLIRREDRSTVIYTANETHKTSDSLSSVERRLNPKHFFRSHKSYIINLAYIDSITPYGRWTYAIKLKGIREDALITSDKLDELKRRFD
ncbi:MAG: LytR/AlgR family response regulator transcription factor [Christensenellales bacterium]|jgi:two-component system LytT family response regulator